MKKQKSLKAELFNVIDMNSLMSPANIKGGKDTKSSTTGWTCKDAKDGSDAGPWTPKFADDLVEG